MYYKIHSSTEWGEEEVLLLVIVVCSLLLRTQTIILRSIYAALEFVVWSSLLMFSYSVSFYYFSLLLVSQKLD